MKKLLSCLIFLGLTIAPLAVDGVRSDARAERYYYRYPPPDRRDPPPRRQYHDDYRKRRAEHQRYHRAYDHCARHFPERSSKFDRCLKYERNPGQWNGW